MKLAIMLIVSAVLASLVTYHLGHWYGRLDGMAEITKDMRVK